MPNNKTISEIPHSICKAACLIKTFSEPDLRLMELEKNSIKKNNFNRTRSLSMSHSSVFFNSSPASDSDYDDEVFTDNEENYRIHASNTTPPTPYHTPHSSYQSIPRFFISSSSSVASLSSIQSCDNFEDHHRTTNRRYTF